MPEPKFYITDVKIEKKPIGSLEYEPHPDFQERKWYGVIGRDKENLITSGDSGKFEKIKTACCRLPQDQFMGLIEFGPEEENKDG